MNFGFTFGDENIPQPYFYVTAYPMPDGLPGTETVRRGRPTALRAVLHYDTLLWMLMTPMATCGISGCESAGTVSNAIRKSFDEE